MALALALPLLLALGALTAAGAVRAARRRIAINSAVHELRRPLQTLALALAPPAPDPGCAAACLEQAAVALEALEASVNRRGEKPTVVRTALAEIIAGLERRWRFADVRVEATGADVLLDADPDGLGAALDNLVWNALSHGSRPVRIRASTAAGTARFEVRDGGPAEPPPERRRGRGRGHGLRVVERVASEHGGTVLAPTRTREGGTVAALSLPAAHPRS